MTWTVTPIENTYNVPTTASGTFTVTDGVNGGDCTSIGVWDASTKTCDITADITGGIIVGSDGITIDGHSKSITHNSSLTTTPLSWSMIYIDDKSDITIRDFQLFGGGEYSVEIKYSTNVSIKQITASGIRLVGSTDVIISDNVLTRALAFYIESYSNDPSSNILIENNTLNGYSIFIHNEGSGISFVNNILNTSIDIQNSVGSQSTTITGNTFNSNTDYQLKVKSTSGSGWNILSGGYVITTLNEMLAELFAASDTVHVT